MNNPAQSSKRYYIQMSCSGYNISDAVWKITGQTYVDCWKQIATTLSSHTYEGFGATFDISFDWSEMPRLALRMHRAHERLYRAAKEGKDPFRAARFPRKPATIKILSEANNQPDYEHRHEALIVCRLHDIFLIAN